MWRRRCLTDEPVATLESSGALRYFELAGCRLQGEGCRLQGAGCRVRAWRCLLRFRARVWLMNFMNSLRSAAAVFGCGFLLLSRSAPKGVSSPACIRVNLLTHLGVRSPHPT